MFASKARPDQSWPWPRVDLKISGNSGQAKPDLSTPENNIETLKQTDTVKCRHSQLPLVGRIALSCISLIIWDQICGVLDSFTVQVLGMNMEMCKY